MLQQAEAKAPGKLFIAGEYAVVEPGYPAVIVAVDRFITVSVSPARKETGTIHSSVLSNEPLDWIIRGHEVILEEPDQRASIITATLTALSRYLHDCGIKLAPLDIYITSEMVSSDGLKYGLGSSGAVTVALIQAVTRAYALNLNPLQIYKLACLSHLSLGSRGSFGDLAAASFTGWIAYTRFSSQPVYDMLDFLSIKETVERHWPDLMIESLPPFNNLHFLVGWTGAPASTENLVKSVSRSDDALTYTRFLEESRHCVTDLINAIKKQNQERFLAALSKNQDILYAMTAFQKREYVTPLLEKLLQTADAHQATGKISGAGGGDCGIAFLPDEMDPQPLLSEWKKAGITPLSLAVYHKPTKLT